MQDTDSPLAGLLRLEDYQQQRQQFFPGLESVRWFMRARRAALIERGGLVYIAGRLFVHPERFDLVVLEAGTSAAAKRETSRGEVA